MVAFSLDLCKFQSDILQNVQRISREATAGIPTTLPTLKIITHGVAPVAVCENCGGPSPRDPICCSHACARAYLY